VHNEVWAAAKAEVVDTDEQAPQITPIAGRRTSAVFESFDGAYTPKPVIE